LSRVVREALAISPGDAEAQGYAAGRPTWIGAVPNSGSLSNYERGLWLLGRQRFADAAQAFRRSVTQDSESSAACNNLGWALAKLGFYEDAIPWFARALKIDPKMDLARNNLAWARSEMAKTP